MLIGERNERQYVELDEHRMGFSIRPAYRIDPAPVVEHQWLHIVEGVIMALAAVAALGLCVHAMWPKIHS